MLTFLLNRILESRLFQFVVGERVDGTATLFSVHEEAIAQLSQPLYNLMRSGLSESQSARTIWNDVSKDTFVRFVQFAYTGDYSIPVMDARETAVGDEDVCGEVYEDSVAEEIIEEPVPEPRSAPVDFGWGSFTTKKPKTPKKPSRKAVFNALTFHLLSPRNHYDDTLEPSDTFDPDKVYSHVFISHAALWILGDYHLIDSLKALALYKLYKTLRIFQPNNKNVGDVIDLVKYVYSEEGGGGGVNEGISELRNLVCQFIAVNATALSDDEKFMEFLAEGGHFVKDFFKFSSGWVIE